MGANGFIIMSIFVCTIIASIFSSYYDHFNYDIKTISIALIGLSALGYIIALFLPESEPSSPKIKYSINTASKEQGCSNSANRDPNCN